MTSRVAHRFSTSRESLAASHLGNSEITRDCTGSFLQLLFAYHNATINPHYTALSAEASTQTFLIFIVVLHTVERCLTSRSPLA